MDAVERLAFVRAEIEDAAREAGRPSGCVELVAVSKTFAPQAILPVIEAGQRVFGENRVQEAQRKWPELCSRTGDIELHLIGPLQSNKAADAVALFDVVNTVDRDKIAGALADEMAKQNRTLRFYVQVNTGSEPQKAGVLPNQAVAFVDRCRSDFGLTIEGLTCIPPISDNPGPHFALLAKLAAEAGLAKLSMGMSADFRTAIAFGATSVRLGTAIFGERSPPPS